MSIPESESISDEIIALSREAVSGLCPKKSRNRYEAEFQNFLQWLQQKQTSTINETVLLAYFSEKSKVYQSSSLWSKYSLLKKMLIINKNVDISQFCKLISFLKNQAVGHEPKKSNILTKEEVTKFIVDAPDDVYLMHKIVLVFGLFGACRRGELVDITIDDIEDRGSVLVVTLPKTKTNKKRIFTIVEDDSVSGLKLYRKYAALRLANVTHRRFFLRYRNNTCFPQPVGKNTIGTIPKVIATYLHLPNPNKYTGHSFRRTSATLLADSGADITSIKRHGGWKSTNVAEGYLEDSITSKNKITRSILGKKSLPQYERGSMSSSEGTSSVTSVPSHESLANMAANSFTEIGITTADTPIEMSSSPISRELKAVAPSSSFSNVSNCTFNIYNYYK